MTLGVMCLNEANEGSTQDDGAYSTEEHTVSLALGLLKSLRDPIASLLSPPNLDVKLSPVGVDFTRIDVMRPTRAAEGSAHVLWTGPDPDSTDSGFTRLRSICGKSPHCGMLKAQIRLQIWFMRHSKRKAILNRIDR